MHEILVVYLMASIVRIKFNFQAIFAVIIFFTTIYCFNFVFIPSQRSAYFLVALYFHYQNHQKSSNYFHFFLQYISICMINKQTQSIYTVNIFTIINFFKLWCIQLIDINPSAMLFVEIFEIDHLVVKITSSILITICLTFPIY